jgi:hypothetical protein
LLYPPGVKAFAAPALGAGRPAPAAGAAGNSAPAERTGRPSANSVSIRYLSTASSWISASLGDSVIASVSPNMSRLMPASSGTMKEMPLAPPMAAIEPPDVVASGYTRIAAIPV